MLCGCVVLNLTNKYDIIPILVKSIVYSYNIMHIRGNDALTVYRCSIVNTIVVLYVARKETKIYNACHHHNLLQYNSKNEVEKNIC